MANINYQTETAITIVCHGITASQYLDEYGFEAYPLLDQRGRKLLSVGSKPVLDTPVRSGVDIILTWA